MITIRVNDRSISAETYLAGLQLAKANPDRLFRTTLWGWWPGTGREIVAQYRRDLNRRITGRGSAARRSSRVHPATWGKAHTPRVVLENHELRSLNRHARRHLAHRARGED